MKNLSILFSLALLLSIPVSATTHFSDKVIALDAGHGSTETDYGATGYCNTVPVRESDVNLKVAETLKSKIESSEPNATVVILDRVPSRKDRVSQAESLGADVLISIHHNGSSDTSVDYTQTFITQNSDKKLANPIHKALVGMLGLPDKGIKHDGFGMTVYGSFPSILTEAYFITNTSEACNFLSSEQLRVQQEVDGFYNGLNTYFSENTGDGGNGNKGGNGRGKNQ